MTMRVWCSGHVFGIFFIGVAANFQLQDFGVPSLASIDNAVVVQTLADVPTQSLMPPVANQIASGFGGDDVVFTVTELYTMPGGIMTGSRIVFPESRLPSMEEYVAYLASLTTTTTTSTLTTTTGNQTNTTTTRNETAVTSTTTNVTNMSIATTAITTSTTITTTATTTTRDDNTDGNYHHNNTAIATTNPMSALELEPEPEPMPEAGTNPTTMAPAPEADADIRHRSDESSDHTIIILVTCIAGALLAIVSFNAYRYGLHKRKIDKVEPFGDAPASPRRQTSLTSSNSSESSAHEVLPETATLIVNVTGAIQDDSVFAISGEVRLPDGPGELLAKGSNDDNHCLGNVLSEARLNIEDARVHQCLEQASFTFNVRLHKLIANDRFGILLNDSDLTIREVPAGWLAAAYNASAHRRLRIRPGDRVISVNNSQDEQAMLSILDDAMELDLVLERSHPEAAIEGERSEENMDVAIAIPPNDASEAGEALLDGIDRPEEEILRVRTVSELIAEAEEELDAIARAAAENWQTPEDA